MADPIATLRRCLSTSGSASKDEGRVSFHDAMTALVKVGTDRSPEATALLRDLALHGAPLELAPPGHAGHMVSAEGRLRALAASELASRDPIGHLEVLASIAFGPGEEHVRSSALFHFRNAASQVSAPRQRSS